MSAPNIYTKSEVNLLLVPTATTIYVDDQTSYKANTADMAAALALKADKATTYTMIEVDAKLDLKGQCL